jgi:photosystem II stability/assembly factor-like uncharacterized protein
MRCGRLGAILALWLPAAMARGNGAFPDSQTVLTPDDRPMEVLLSTNFGLITSDDGGGRWTWSCEQDPNGTRNLYQLGPSPRHRLFARDSSGLVFTDDLGCRWTAATGALDGAVIADAFPDPTNAERVLAVAAPRGGTNGGYRVLESFDAGTTFNKTLYAAAPGDTVSGVEISRTDPAVIYLVVLKGAMLEPTLAHSVDGGAVWEEHDLSAKLGAGSVLLAAVDRKDPQRVFLQVNGATSNVLAVIDGGGVVVKTPLRLEGGFMSGFLQTTAGTILVSGLVGADPVLYRSRDGADTFTSLPAPPTLWGLSERTGTIFGAARTGAPFAIAKSSDEGATWQPFMRFADTKAVAACAQVACEDTCLFEASLQLWPTQICSPASPLDASSHDAGSAGEEATNSSGCGCALVGGRDSCLFLPAALLMLRRRRTPRKRNANSGTNLRQGANNVTRTLANRQ